MFINNDPGHMLFQLSLEFVILFIIIVDQFVQYTKFNLNLKKKVFVDSVIC